MKNILLFSLFGLSVISSLAQVKKPSIKFGNIKIADLSLKSYNIDTTAQAVVLYNYCEVKYEGDRGLFSVIYKYHKRIHLLSKNSFSHATVNIPLFKWGFEEDVLDKLEAVTYNLKDGAVVKSKIDKSSVFKDKVNKEATFMKFTFPDITEGSIIEYTYTIISPTQLSLRSWNFQESLPVIWSEYTTTVPSIFQFLNTRQGYQPFAINTVNSTTEGYYLRLPSATERGKQEFRNVNLETINSDWAMENIPALKKENFTTTIANHISRISFQLSALRFPNQPVQPIVQTWNQVAEKLLKNENFGADLDNNNSWMVDDIKKITLGETNDKVRAKKLFEYVRDNFICTRHDDFVMSQSLKKVFNAKQGNVAELNLLLVAMYRNIGLKAKPVILSTRDNGWAPEAFPLLNKFNYTICLIELGEENFLIDASHPKLGFGKLIPDCYNGSGRVIDAYPNLINLSADSILESKVTSVFISNSEKSGFTGSFSSKYGYFESLELREQLVKQKEEDFFNNLKKQYSFEIELSNKSIDSLKIYEEPVEVKYEFSFNSDEDIIYFNPFLTEAYKENPFKAATRSYPVEMPYTSSETYLLNMAIPKGYMIDEMPKSSRVKLNETEGMFEYIIGKAGDGIMLRCTIKINVANFTPENYDTLREFYANIVKKQSEQIVFKKIK